VGGINEGSLTPFKVKQIATPLERYIWAPDDKEARGNRRKQAPQGAAVQPHHQG